MKINMALSYSESLLGHFRSELVTCVVDYHTFFRSLFLTTLSPSCLLNLMVCALVAIEP